MAVDMFLKIDGIKGESTDAKHPGEIVIESFSWGEASEAAEGRGGKVEMQDFHFTMPINLASPLLAFRCADGKQIETALLTCRKASTQNQLEYLKIKFDDIVISSYQTGGSQADVVPLDAFSLFFMKIELTYTSQSPDGKAGPSTTFVWDRKQV
jgi:type VI secretion system secreted protein Hcp